MIGKIHLDEGMKFELKRLFELQMQLVMYVSNALTKEKVQGVINERNNSDVF